MLHRRRLRSASTNRLDVPTCRLSTVGDRAFPVAGAKVWNGLPSDVTSASSLAVFKNRLKTYLFRRCYETLTEWHLISFPSNFTPPQNSGPCNSVNYLATLKCQLLLMMMMMMMKHANVWNAEFSEGGWKTHFQFELRLWTNVHVVLRRRRRPLVVYNALAHLCIACFVPKI